MGDDMTNYNAPASQGPKTLDELLSKVGIFSSIQVLVHLTVFYLLLFVSCLISAVFFTGYSPPWKCLNQSTSDFCHNHLNTTFSIDMDMFSHRCVINRSEWTYVTQTTYSWVTEFDLVCSQTPTAALLGVVFYIGGVLGAFASGPVADSFGRKPTLLSFVTIAGGACIAMRFIGDIWQLYILHFICGVGAVGSVLTSFVFIAEFSPPKYRSITSNAAVLCTCISFMVMDLLAYLLQSWRLLTLYLGALLLPFVLIFIFLPESPRWLLTHGKGKEAEIILSKMNHSKGIIRVPAHSAERSSDSNLYTYWDFVKNCRVLVFTLQALCLWAALPVIFYTISVQSLNYSGNMYLNYFLASVVDIPAFFLAAYSTKTIGRKKTTLVGCLLSGLVISVVPAIPREFAYQYSFTMCLTISSRFSCSVAFYGVFLWTTELFPTVVRAQGMAICTTFEKISMIAVPFICTFLQTFSYCLPFVVMGVLGLVGFLAALSLPETNKQATREKFEDFFPRSDTAPSNEVGMENYAHDLV